MIVDAVTGEVVAIQPRRFNRSAERGTRREIPREERYYLDDPEDMARLRRDQMRENGGRYLPPPDDYGVAEPDYGEPAIPG